MLCMFDAADVGSILASIDSAQVPHKGGDKVLERIKLESDCREFPSIV